MRPTRGEAAFPGSDYQITVLEVVGSAADHQEILAMEGRWQRKLQSHEMGLNRNLAKK